MLYAVAYQPRVCTSAKYVGWSWPLSGVKLAWVAKFTLLPFFQRNVNTYTWVLNYFTHQLDEALGVVQAGTEVEASKKFNIQRGTSQNGYKGGIEVSMISQNILQVPAQQTSKKAPDRMTPPTM